MAARLAGRVVGRAAGSLRRVRMEVEAMQTRAAAAGNPELLARREDLRNKVDQLRSIQAEAASLLNLRPTAMFTTPPSHLYGAASGGQGSGTFPSPSAATAPSAFSDAELAMALQPSGATESNTQAASHLNAAPVAPALSSAVPPSPSLPSASAGAGAGAFGGGTFGNARAASASPAQPTASDGLSGAQMMAHALQLEEMLRRHAAAAAAEGRTQQQTQQQPQTAQDKHMR